MSLQASDQSEDGSKQPATSREQALESNVNDNDEGQEDVKVRLVAPHAAVTGDILR